MAPQVTHGGVEQVGSINWLMFENIPNDMAVMLREDNLGLFDQWIWPNVIDAEEADL